jgi:hypothetical protein
VTEKTGSVEEQVQETIDRVKATVEGAREGFKQVQEMVNGAIPEDDKMLERVQGTAHETVERLKPTADLLEQVQQNPWLLMGSAILLGYILGNPAREDISAH